MCVLSIYIYIYIYNSEIGDVRSGVRKWRLFIEQRNKRTDWLSIHLSCVWAFYCFSSSRIIKPHFYPYKNLKSLTRGAVRSILMERRGFLRRPRILSTYIFPWRRRILSTYIFPWRRCILSTYIFPWRRCILSIYIRPSFYCSFESTQFKQNQVKASVKWVGTRLFVSDGAVLTFRRVYVCVSWWMYGLADSANSPVLCVLTQSQYPAATRLHQLQKCSAQ